MTVYGGGTGVGTKLRASHTVDMSYIYHWATPSSLLCGLSFQYRVSLSCPGWLQTYVVVQSDLEWVILLFRSLEL